MAVSFATLFQAIGLLTTVNVCYRFFRFLRLYNRPSTITRYLDISNPTWALVTGATDGIGKAFAYELCSLGFNVILHGRNVSKLSSTQKDLEAKFPGRAVASIVVDASNATEDSYNSILSAVEDKNLRILINNVGGVFQEPWLKCLESLNQAEAEQTIDVNLRFPTQLTRALLPILTKNSPALIINIGSLSSIFQIPYGVIYSGAKAYVSAFSGALRAEMRAEKKDVEVLTVQVGMTSTGTNKVPVNFMTPSARTLARGALQRVGCGQPIAFGHWPHHFTSFVMNLLPAPILEVVLKRRVLSSINSSTKKED
ncbi:putative short chain dehydrogenase/reductase [Cryomyces antarcticus]